MIKNPAHPETGLKKAVFDWLGLSVSEAAIRLDMLPPALSRVLNGRAGISPKLAIRLEAAGVSQARFWLNMQINYDLALARSHQRPNIQVIQDRQAA
jgi:antitoxin HigA-1